MLKRLRVKGFKSLADIEVAFPDLTVLFGPNATGKSNLLDALLVLSRLATERTITDALTGPVRGYPSELFRFPAGGLAELHDQEKARFVLEADIETKRRMDLLRYRVAVDTEPKSGALSVVDEYLSRLSRTGSSMGSPALQIVGGEIHIRRKSKPARPRTEPVGLSHTQLSDMRFSGAEYLWIERARNELSTFRTYYLDPRVAMRRAVPPREVTEIGPLGEDLAPFLYRLRYSEYEKYFHAIERTLKSIIPSVEDLTVDLDKKRGTLDIQIAQDGTPFSSRIISEGTLRVLALCAIAANPWPGSLVAFEEPENGVHPRRLELIARLLGSMTINQGQQVIVTTHSPLFCQKILALQRDHPEKVALLIMRQKEGMSRCEPFQSVGPLFEDQEIKAALSSQYENGWFEGLVLRGLVDG
ncbi:MAG: AAA family ATPase [Deltaproteobacteria bacterium]|nr:AAA family ATPase [Deltaproteobacteria bacterium]